MGVPRRAALAAGLLAGALVTTAPAEAATRRGPSLKAFRTCTNLVDVARAAATERPVPFRGPVNWTGSDVITPRAEYAKPDPNRPIALPGIAVATSAPVSAESGKATADASTVASSGTNVQEAGIDEPDLVKAVGGRLFVVAGSTLWALDATGDTPRVLGKLDLAGKTGTLLIEGDRALLLTPREPRALPIAMPFDGIRAAAADPAPTRLTELDIADPAAMRILRTVDVPGDLVSARLTDGTVRVVLNSSAALGGGPAGVPEPQARQGTAKGLTARAARRLRLASFVPRTKLASRVTGKTYDRQLVGCADVRSPSEPFGTDLLTILTIDLRKGLFNIDRDAVLGSAQTVYASPTGLYVAGTDAADATSPDDAARRPTTSIFRFSITSRDETTFASSGTVPGYVLGQYSMSEHAGALRVATTREPGWFPDAAADPSESFVTVLEEDGRTLAQTGQVGGLGKSERIYAARFIGDVGYLVTFRQVDPLYTLDLSDPRAPRVAGELKITGYSAYLHPVGDDLLLGIGREATEQGRATGAAVSLFDVADPTAPKIVARKALDPNSSTAVEFDPHAFLFWAPTRLAVVPSQSPGDWRTTVGSIGAANGLRIDRAGIADVGTVRHGPEWDHPMVKRTVVVGSRVVTLSDLGVQASGLDDLAPRGYLPWIGS
ncbi:MAG: beta-propeller domain-containing protein [Patulibacter minatonensis]